MKKTFSLILTFALIFSFSVTGAFAATGNSTGAQTITGTGTTAYLDLEIYAVTLPTSAALNFTLDPQGLLGIEDGESLSMNELSGGQIVPASAAPKAINNSAVDITLSIELGGTGAATFIEFDADDTTTLAKVEADTANNVLLYAVPSSANIVSASTDYLASDKGYVIKKGTVGTSSADTITLKFLLAAAEYEISKDSNKYVATAKTNTGSGTAIQLGGRVNTKADWSDYAASPAAKSVGVGAVFTFAKASAAEIATPTVAGFPGLMETMVGSLTLTPAVVPTGFVGVANPLVGTLSATAGSNVNETVDFNFDGAAVNTGYVYYGATKLVVNAINASLIFDDVNGKVGIKGNWGTPGTAVITFKLMGDDSTIYTLTVTTT